jgi:hypothetical protein
MSSIITIEINNLLTEYVRTRPITHSAQLDQRIVMIVVGFVGTYVAVISGWFRGLYDKLYKRVFPDPPEPVNTNFKYESDNEDIFHFRIEATGGTVYDYAGTFAKTLLIENENNINKSSSFVSIDKKADGYATLGSPGGEGQLWSSRTKFGTSVYLYRLMNIVFEKRQITVAKWQDNNSTYRWHLYITLNKEIGDTREAVTKVAINFTNAVIDFARPTPETKTFELYEISKGEWKKSGKLTKKSKDTLVGENSKYILDDIEFFQTKIKDVYETFDIPYKRGYMLYGPPGTGKTSTVKCVASHANMNIYKVTFNEENMGNDDYIRLLSETSANSIVLLEDIDPALLQEGGFIEKDCSSEMPPQLGIRNINDDGDGYGIGGGGGDDNINDGNNNTKVIKKGNNNNDDDNDVKGNKSVNPNKINYHISSLYKNLSRQKKRVSYGMLLDALDGINANSGRITFITTNHPNKIGKALLRPGRIDKKIKMDYATNEEICEYFKMFYRFFSLDSNLIVSSAERFIKKARNHSSGCKISFAQLQQHLVRHLRDIEVAVDTVNTMFEPEEYESYM